MTEQPAPPRPRVLVTGGLGFIGSRLAAELANRGTPTLVVDGIVNEPSPTDLEYRLGLIRGCEFISGMIQGEDPGLPSRLADFAPAVIVHCAARPGVRGSFSEPTLYYSNNLVSLSSSLELAYRVGARVIFLSSSSVYGKLDDRMSEKSALRPVSPYGSSKVLGEEMVHHFWRMFGVESVILRPFTVFGEFGRPDMMPARLLRSALRGTPVNYFGDNLVRDWTYVGDVVDRIMRVIERASELQGVQTFNLGSGRPYSLGTFRRLIESEVGKMCNLNYVNPPADEVASTCSDPVKFQQYFGDTDCTPIHLAIRRMASVEV